MTSNVLRLFSLLLFRSMGEKTKRHIGFSAGFLIWSSKQHAFFIVCCLFIVLYDQAILSHKFGTIKYHRTQ